MKISKGYKHNFETLQRAGENQDLCIMDARDRATGKSVVLVCAAQHGGDGSVEFMPLAVMIDGNPYHMYDPPNPAGGYLKETT